jgi:hypothetical protein
MKRSGPANLTVYNMMGQKVATLFDGNHPFSRVKSGQEKDL